MNSFELNKIEYYIDNPTDGNPFVGIRIINGKYHLSFPIGFTIEEKDENYYKMILRYLYKTILLTKNINLDKNDHYNNEEEKTIPLSSYIYIISDYYSNGIYKYNESKYRNDYVGNINWKRSFKNSFYLQDSTPIYLNTVIKYNKKESNIITLLQLYAVNKAMDMLTFMGNFNKPHSALTDKDLEKNISHYNNIIEKEIKNTNNDKKKLFLINIKNIINDSCGSSTSIRTFGTYTYEYSFEKMINKIFGSENDLSNYYPTALWFLDGDKIGFESSKLREDTIWKGNNKVYIIDSKYYKYGIENDDNLLPKTSAIHKQIVYGDYVYNKLKNEEGKEYKIYNVFVIPSNRDDFLEYKGYTKMKLIDDSNDYKYVYLLFINMNELIEKYFNNECNQISKMMETIEKTRVTK